VCSCTLVVLVLRDCDLVVQNFGYYSTSHCFMNTRMHEEEPLEQMVTDSSREHVRAFQNQQETKNQVFQSSGGNLNFQDDGPKIIGLA
jgi:hypothetical protein